MIRNASFVLLTLAILTIPLAASTQQEPYAPTIVPTKDLMLLELFSSSPLLFPWDELSTGRTPVRGRMDFEIIYDIDFQSAKAELLQAYEDHEEFIELSDVARHHTAVRALRIAGIDNNRGQLSITATHRDIEQVFQARLEPDGPRTRVIVANSALTRTFSGFMPARVDFSPAGAKPIPFRWN